MFHQLTLFLASLFDRFDTKKQKESLETLIVRLAATGFIVHLLLIALARTVPFLGAGALAGLNRNFLHAVYTPFSFILFYEVLLLVLALPRSHTTAIGKQYEIVSLIVIRGVFKDIGEFRDLTDWLAQRDAALMVFVDMVAALLMFMLVTGFRRVSLTVIKSPSDNQFELFVAIKKSIAALLCVVLLLLAVYNFTEWLSSAVGFSWSLGGESKDLDYFFFPAFFEFMIFTDVFLLIVSIPFYERYEYVIRNAGFVISTVLLRISLSTPKPYDLAIGLVAMIYGLCVLSVFSYFTRFNASTISGPEA